MKPLVIYHANCYDGFAAAWVYREYWKACKNDPEEIEFVPAKYGDPPPDVTGRDVTILDFSYDRQTMVTMNESAGLMVVLDHHKTAQEACEGLDFCNFDMKRSGAGLAWDQLFGTTRPWLLDRIEDRDLWNFKLDYTKEAHAYVASLPMNFEEWDRAMTAEPRDVVALGFAISHYIDRYVEKMLEQCSLRHAPPHDVVMVNAPYLNCSELLHAALEQYPECAYAMSYYQRSDGRWQYSLRSRPDFDVSEVAKGYGGGGHAQAAGFVSFDPDSISLLNESE